VSLWHIELTVPAAAAEIVADALAAFAVSVSIFEAEPDNKDRQSGLAPETWRDQLWHPQNCRIEALCEAEPGRAEVTAALAVAATSTGVTPPEITIAPIANRDWLEAGRYFVHGSYHDGALPAGRIAMEIDAATAFGTGEHATTRGCLLALDRLAGRRSITNALDIGCGTGILAIAIARTWSCPVLACDIESEAVRVAGENVRRNDVAERVTVVESDGYGAGAIARRAPYDLITANILMQPLIRMVPDLARHLAADGVAVLSGLLAEQVTAVVTAHATEGLRLLERIQEGDWVALTLGR
jgi:ribosomal protein L11 methyltransferase